MQLKDHFQYRPRLYRVTFEWLPEEVPDTDDDLDAEERAALAECDEEPCEDCGMVHGPWESDETTVLVRGDAKKAAELVEIWVMSEAFAKLYMKARAVRTLSITCMGEARLTPQDLGLPEE